MEGNTTLRPRASRGHLWGAAALLLTAATSQAAVLVTGTSLLNTTTGRYDYTYSVEVTGTDDGILVEIPAARLADIIGVFNPIGFSGRVDSFSGIIRLAEDDDLFTPQTFAAGSTVTPFTFSSSLEPLLVTYTGFDVAGNSFTGTVPAPVPEPSATLLTGLLSPLLLLRRRRCS